MNSNVAIPPHSLEAKFLSKVEKSDGCWLWRGSIPKSGDGYGWFSLGPRSERAHRVAHRLFMGPIPAGKLVCHTCDNRICVNPGHLFIGSAADNNKDRARKGRSSRHPQPRKINFEIAQRIRAEYAIGGRLQREIGAGYGISQAVVSKIILGKTWIRS